MTPTVLPVMAPALPELLMAGGALLLLLFGVLRDASGRAVSALALGLLAVVLVVVVRQAIYEAPGHAFFGLYMVDGFALFLKVLILLGAGLVLPISRIYLADARMDRFEFPVLIVLATLGMMLMVSASNLLTLYLALELQSLSLYVLAALRRESPRASEAGLKYFVLGALASGMLLYGASLVYGFTGTLSFDRIAAALSGAEGGALIGAVVGVVFVLAGLAFKVSAFPFHMWTPDVYEGAPTPVTAFFAAAPKVAAMGLLVRVTMGPFGELAADWQQVVIVIAIGSMFLGALAAIGQRNLKRLMAYSSIGHVGYAFVGLASGTVEGVQGVLIYLAIYLAMTLGTFGCILAMRGEDGPLETIDDLAGLARDQPLLAAAFATFMFSLAGVPPLAGFFGKFYVFMAAIDAGLYTLAVLGVLSSAIGAFYYLRVVKVMYFDAPAAPFRGGTTLAHRAVIAGTCLFTLAYVLFPAPLVASAAAAARSLMPVAG